MKYRPQTRLALKVYLDELAYFNNGHDAKELFKQFESGATNKEIAKMTGRDRRTVSYWRKAYLQKQPV